MNLPLKDNRKGNNMREIIHGGDIYNHKNVLDYSANINPLGISDKVMEAAKNGIAMSIHYPDIACRKLCKEISKAEKISKNFILCGNGAADLIFSFVIAVKPKKALLIAPTFAEYEAALKTVSCHITYYDLKEKNDFIVQDNIIDCITEETDVLFLCNPNNPTGQLTDKELLIKIANRCKENNCYFIIDECFNDFLDYPEKVSMKSELYNYPNIVILKAFTKMYAMPGLRLGYCMSRNSFLLEKMEAVTQPWNVSIPAQEAGIAALKEKKYVEKTKKLIKEERAYIIKELENMGICVIGSKANYIFFYCENDLYKACLKKHILIRDCSNYSGLKKGYYRIAVRKPEENKILIQVLKSILC